MLPKIHRLTKRTDIARVHTKGQAFFTKLFVLKLLPNQLDYSRFAVVISSKVHKHAVARNRARRVMHGVLETTLGMIKPGYDVIFILSPRCFTEDKKRLHRTALRDTTLFALRSTKLLRMTPRE